MVKRKKKRPHRKITSNLGLQKYFSLHASKIEKELDIEFTEFMSYLTNTLVDEILDRIIKCNAEFVHKTDEELRNYRDKVYPILVNKVDNYISSNQPLDRFEAEFINYLTNMQVDMINDLNNRFFNISENIISTKELNDLMVKFSREISTKLKQLITKNPTDILHSRLVAKATTATCVVDTNISHLLKCANANIKDLVLNYYTSFSGILLETFKTVLYDKNLNNINFESNTKIDDIPNSQREYKHRTWRELNSLAVKCGYTMDRYHGDHAIYVNSSGRVVVIPQGRDIGKGLQIAIVKDIEGC